ncbi:hypothetical protein IWQ62_003091 [Dispira parvispora]|uniref:Uncharacterized protein n=1 Tax=Dispira parvispora TaxID=1520584 RepID=A0A9W8ANL5_9FUNG|nr:hypothetical protein IWQ62_003091 [Dispira parvispora]
MDVISGLLSEVNVEDPPDKSGEAVPSASGNCGTVVTDRVTPPRFLFPLSVTNAGEVGWQRGQPCLNRSLSYPRHYHSRVRRRPPTATTHFTPVTRPTQLSPLGTSIPLLPRTPLAIRRGPRRCIIYLEPSRSSWLYQRLTQFFRITQDKFGPSEAHQYHPHCSLSGFIPLVDGLGCDGSREKTPVPLNSGYFIQAIGDALNCLVTRTLFTGQGQALQSPRVTGLTRPAGTQDKLILDLAQTEPFRQLIQRLIQALSQTPKFASVNIRPKPVSHISLIYFNKAVPATSTLTPLQMEEAYQLAESLFFSPPTRAPLSWDIVFYEQTFQSRSLEIPHSFEELARWKLL